MWSAAEGAPHKCIAMVTMDSGVAAVAASAALVAVSFNGKRNKARKGVLHLYAFPEMTFVAEIVVSRETDVSEFS